MIFSKKPLFMQNEAWYEKVDLMTSQDEDDRGYILTDMAPKEARESYDAYYAILDEEVDPLDEEMNRIAFG